MTTALSAEALAALRNAVADHNSITVPIITDRKVYAQVDRALSRIAGGGRWDRRARAHVYTQDPRRALQELTGTAVIPAPSPTRDKEMSYWPTPPALAAELIDRLELEPDARVLEPSAGDGALFRALKRVHPLVRITAVEPDHGRCTVLRMNEGPGTDVWDCTFEDYVKDVAPEIELFDAVVMNPPFTLPGRRYAWAEHLLLAWVLLKPGGALRAIVPASLEFGRQRPIAAARDLLAHAGGCWWRARADAFQPSGTSVQTMIVHATKPIQLAL